MEFLIKMTVKIGVFAIIMTLITNVILDVALPFLEILTNGSIQTLLESIDYFVPLPFLCSCLFWLLYIKYISVFWNFYNWIYNMIFM